ncbi:MAG: TetR/AcrR family transcriptional regulator [Gemmatimonadota bacterium]
MSPRPRKATDREIFEAVLEAVARVGPERMTLAEVADAVGVTAGALVQRFDSKRGLLLAAIRASNEALPGRFEAVRARHGSPLAALFDYAERAADAADTPEELANQLGVLRLDPTDADFRAEAVRYFRAERETFEWWIAEAVTRGELAATADADRLARAVQAVLNGTRLVGMVEGGEAVGRAVRRELRTLLEPHRGSGG